jgi:hypothetical protein
MAPMVEVALGHGFKNPHDQAKVCHFDGLFGSLNFGLLDLDSKTTPQSCVWPFGIWWIR